MPSVMLLAAVLRMLNIKNHLLPPLRVLTLDLKYCLKCQEDCKESSLLKLIKFCSHSK